MSDEPPVWELTPFEAADIAMATVCANQEGPCKCPTDEQLRLIVAAVTPVIGAKAWDEGFERAHTQHYQEDLRLSRRTPAIVTDNPYRENT